MFLVSRGFSFVKSGDLVWGSDSPVSEELSTCPEKSTKCMSTWASSRLPCYPRCTAPTARAFPPTLQPLAEMILRSAGIRSPPFTSTRSPTTTSSAFMLIFSPFRITRACFGRGEQFRPLHQRKLGIHKERVAVTQENQITKGPIVHPNRLNV